MRRRAAFRALGQASGSGRPDPLSLGIGFITRILIAYVLALFVRFAHATGVLGGAEFGFLAWLGFVLPVLPVLAGLQWARLEGDGNRQR